MCNLFIKTLNDGDVNSQVEKQINKHVDKYTIHILLAYSKTNQDKDVVKIETVMLLAYTIAWVMLMCAWSQTMAWHTVLSITHPNPNLTLLLTL